MNAYIFSWNNVYSPEYVSYLLNDTQAIETWVSPISGTAILVSKLSVIDLSSVLHGRLGEAWFVLVEATPYNSSGWLPANFWTYINNPQSMVQRNYLEELLASPPKNELPPRGF
jgi:hypothetical protein